MKPVMNSRSTQYVLKTNSPLGMTKKNLDQWDDRGAASWPWAGRRSAMADFQPSASQSQVPSRTSLWTQRSELSIADEVVLHSLAPLVSYTRFVGK